MDTTEAHFYHNMKKIYMPDKNNPFYKAPEELSIGDYVKVTDTKLFEGLTEEEYSKAYRIIEIEPIPCYDA